MDKTDMKKQTAPIVQLVIPALMGAATAAAGFGAFLYFDANKTPAPVTAAKMEAPVTSVEQDDAQRAMIEKTIKEYLLGNPQILMQMSEALEKQQTDQRDEKIRQVISESSDQIFRDGYGLMAGNPNGNVTVVEFSDYNCPYCKRAFKDVAKLIEKDKNVRVVMKEFPIFGERSEGAARVAIAAGKQGKYFEMHSTLLRHRGANDEAGALKIAEKLGLDMEQLKRDANSEEVKKIISETRELGGRLGIQGTPFYLVGDKVIPGAPETLLREFEQRIAEIRKDGCTARC